MTTSAAEQLRLRPTRACVSLGAIAHNTRVLVQQMPGTKVCAVVKADAYGHGAVQVARASLAAGAHGLAVALVEEGLQLRQAGIGAPIYLLAGHYGNAYDTVIQNGLTPVIGQAEDLAQMDRAAARLGVRFDVHLEVDTGMARLGFDPTAAVAWAQQAQSCKNLRVVGLMTHLSHADEPQAPSTPQQIADFDAVMHAVHALLPDLNNSHVLNSGGLACAAPRPSLASWGMVRCGLALYGVQPVASKPLGALKPALSWLTRPVALRRIAQGSPVSYGSHWRAQRPSTIATLPVGYADGYPRGFTHKAEVLVHGKRAPVVGTICMDLCMIDVTDVPEVDLCSDVTLLGTQGSHTLSAVTLGAWVDSIPYEILARIGPRVPRVYAEAPPCP